MNQLDEVPVDYAKWHKPIFRLSLNEFLDLRDISDGIYVIDYGIVALPILISPQSKKTTFFGFHAAMQGERKPLPFFQGERLAPEQTSSSSVIHHYYPSVTLGWFCRGRHCSLQSDLPLIMDKIEALLSSSGRILFGTSGGGFGSLFYARPIDTTVCVNPQTIIARFSPGPVRRYCGAAWEKTPDMALKEFTSDLCAHYATRELPDIIYLQNSTDHHVRQHLEPFLDAVSSQRHRVRLILGDWGQGHVAPPAEMTRGLIIEQIGR